MLGCLSLSLGCLMSRAFLLLLTHSRTHALALAVQLSSTVPLRAPEGYALNAPRSLAVLVELKCTVTQWPERQRWEESWLIHTEAEAMAPSRQDRHMQWDGYYCTFGLAFPSAPSSISTSTLLLLLPSLLHHRLQLFLLDVVFPSFPSSPTYHIPPCLLPCDFRLKTVV